MLKRYLRVAIAGLVVGSGLGFGYAAAHPGHVHEPNVPDWVNSDGTIIFENLPARLPLLDCTGRVVGFRAHPLDEATDAKWVPPMVPGAECSAGTVSFEEITEATPTEGVTP
jgi:hypothetical protein